MNYNCEHCKHTTNFGGILFFLIFITIPITRCIATERADTLKAECRTTGEVREVYESRVNLWPVVVKETEYLCHDAQTHEARKVWLQR